MTIQYPTTRALRRVLAEPLDGGQITFPAGGLVITLEGTLTFTFRAGHEPGLYQVSLRDGAHELGLQFWVRATQNPANNPTALSAENQLTEIMKSLYNIAFGGLLAGCLFASSTLGDVGGNNPTGPCGQFNGNVTTGTLTTFFQSPTVVIS